MSPPRSPKTSPPQDSPLAHRSIALPSSQVPASPSLPPKSLLSRAARTSKETFEARFVRASKEPLEIEQEAADSARGLALQRTVGLKRAERASKEVMSTSTSSMTSSLSSSKPELESTRRADPTSRESTSSQHSRAESGGLQAAMQVMQALEECDTPPRAAERKGASP